METLNDKAMKLLRDLEQLKLLRFRKEPHPTSKNTKKEVSFDAVASDTRRFKFDRDEANER